MLQDFSKSFKNYFQAILLIKKLNLWKFFFTPAIISLFVAALLLFTIATFSGNIGHQLASYYPFSFGKNVLESIGALLGGLAILGIGMVLYKHIVMALSAPFMGSLSEKIEEHLTGVDCKTPTVIESLSRGIRINLRNMFLELLIVIPCVLLAFIPVVGIIFLAISFLTQAYYAGFSNMDYTLERHLKYKNSIQFVRYNRPTAISNGFLYILALLIPFIGIIFILPVSAIAATLSTIEKLDLRTSDITTI